MLHFPRYQSTALARGLMILLACLAAGGCAHRVDGRLHYVTPAPAGVHAPEFRRAAEALGQAEIIDGNQVELLQNGDEIFPTMLRAIAQARHTINFETYIFWSGKVSQRFADALAERARAGVQVNVLLDAVGSRKISPQQLAQMEAAGCQVAWFHPARLRTMGRLNDRTHRRILVVDGRVGFTGSVGIADPWRGRAQSPDHWRDTQVRVTGPAVARMQAAFAEDWQEATGRVFAGDAYYPPLSRTADHPVQVVKSSPAGSGAPTIRMLFDLAIRSARQSIYIANSYFLPDRLAIQELVAARRRGVEVKILVPGRWIDVGVVQAVSRESYGPLLAAGVEIYEYQPTMMHVKAMVVDGVWSSIGSANFDNRSFAINNEMNLNVYSRDFAIELEGAFFADLAESRPVTAREWLERSAWQRFKGAVLAPIEAYL
ncbi:MAG: cardiolipin synthase [Pseudomonadota bacterium]